MKIECILMIMGLTGLASHAAVLSHYSFDSDYTDGSGNGNDATLTDVGTVGNSGITTTIGESVFGGGAMEFSTDRDYLAFSAQALNGDYTISFWAQQDDAARGWNMAIGERDTNVSFISLRGTGDDVVRWRGSEWVNTSPASSQEEFASVSDTAWHHYAVVGAGTTISLYRDGTLVNTVAGENTDFTVDTIGAAFFSANDFDFEGRIDEVWILDEAADATTVSNLYTTNTLNGVPEPRTAMLASVAVLFLARRRRKSV
ncbi:LamG-like jellyroll fold domain-containing protein [Haloferula rosea]|uniref:LamG domain-containing protein n=1 Tax=Haloferula rosea TaxID=490093 RepID=A0A934R7Q0_9BACT|nr:LamG-like jellyroll fold domain-containing protein [Haloferula rosea]MBK1825802.1 hypothetical protein [Haloferula rosea]